MPPEIQYYRTGSPIGTTVSIDYTYDLDNHLTGFVTTGGPTFTLNNVAIDGLGRLTDANETITKYNNLSTISHGYVFAYDMRSQLTDANISNIATKPYMRWSNTYDDAGNMTNFIYNEGAGDVSKTYSFNGDLVTGDNTGKSVNWDDNGRQTSQISAVPADLALTYDWEGRLRQAKLGNADRRIEARYTPDGARVTKKKVWDGNTVYNHKYIVDIIGKVPAVLLVLDAENNNAILKTYIYANGQVLAQHNGDHTTSRCFYLHDRLGSVRMVIDANGTVVNHYTYNPWGLPVNGETSETISNLYRFASYIYDSEISQYYCINRIYDPVLWRFTSRDPIFGKFEEPLTLHVYLYCLNDPVNYTDPRGLWTIHVMLSGMLSFGPSLMYQTGIVFDDSGNVGWITTSNSPHPIEGLDGDWGLGVGTPAASAGVAIGWTNADEIFDLSGAGISVGGSIGFGLPSIGVDYIRGIQRSGEYYHGFEFVPGVGTAALGGLEAHGHATWTTVKPLTSNRQAGLDIAQESIENSIFDAQTVGEAYALFSIWAYLQ